MDSLISLKIFEKLIDINEKNILQNSNSIISSNITDFCNIGWLEGTSVDGDFRVELFYGSEVDGKAFQENFMPITHKEIVENVKKANRIGESCKSMDELIMNLCCNITDMKFKEKHSLKVNINSLLNILFQCSIF